MNEEKNIIVLSDEEGNKLKFEMLDSIEFEGEEYVIFLPADDEESEEVLILKTEKENGEIAAYVALEDEKIYDNVFRIFKQKYREEFNFID